MSGQIKKELEFRDYYLLLFNHKYLILFTIACFVLPTWYFLSKISDSYDSYSQLAIEETNESLYLISPNVNKKTTGYYTGIFQGRAFQETLLKSLPNEIIPGKTKVEKLNYLSGHINISQGTFNTFIKIKARTESADLSHLLVKVATDSLIVFCKNVENQEARETISAIEDHIGQISEKFNTILDKKNELAQDESQGDIQGLHALQQEYEKQLVAYELQNAELKARQAYFESLDKQMKSQKTTPDKNRLELHEKLATLNREKRKRIQLGLPLSPTDSLEIAIKDLEGQIKTLTNNNQSNFINLDLISKWKVGKKELSAAEAEIQFKKNEIEAFRKTILEFKAEHPQLVNHELEINRYSELLARYESDHKRLTERLEDENIKIRAQTGGLTLVEPAYKPTEPVKKNDYVFYILSVIIGLGFGIGLSLFKSFIDDSIKSPDDIEKHLALPLLGTVPHIVVRKTDLLIKRGTEKNKKELSFRYPELILKGGKTDEGIITEAYRSLRTNLIYSSPDKPLQCFVVTSCGPHEGKSLTAANTALAFSQQGDPTLLVDADLRRPIAHYLFHLKRGPGLGELFTQSKQIDEVIQQVPDSNLDVMTAGAFLPNPAELLGSKKFQVIIKDLRSKYKFVIFDTPPIMAVTDSCVLASKVDGVVVIARAEKTGLHLLERSIQNLEKVKANIFGCVLNDVNLTRGNGYYGYYKAYSHYYQTVKD